MVNHAVDEPPVAEELLGWVRAPKAGGAGRTGWNRGSNWAALRLNSTQGQLAASPGVTALDSQPW